MPTNEVLLALHTFSFIIGVGGATVVYGYFLLKLRDQCIDAAHARFIERVSSLIATALFLLWLSGAGLVYHKYLSDPDILYNAKIQAKVLIVAILTLNGIVIHLKIFPIIRQSVGTNLFSVISPRQRMFLLTGGGISCVSWYLPFALGWTKQIDQVISLDILMGMYLCLLLGAVGMAHILGSILISQDPNLDDLVAAQLRLRQRSPGAGVPAAPAADVPGRVRTQD
jgi:hypothetical protein